jgi:hypothetical protein
MSIAQRFVAGEGDLHPTALDLQLDISDSAALAAFHCDPVNLPWVIFRAAFRASHIEQLPQRARAVLAALARTVDAGQPYAAIFARRELLTGRAMQSMRTFYRSLDDLEAAGFIDRRAQSRYVEAGLFGRAYLHLTERAASLLGLTDDPSVPSSKSVTASIQTPLPAVVVQAGSGLTSSFSDPSANVADGPIYKDLIPNVFQKRQPGQVPEDLLRLRALGFIDFLIFKLMREAREHGKRLSDVVEATWQHLKVAQAPINYLRALLRNPVDFGQQLRRQMAERVEEQNRHDRVAFAETVAIQSAGQTYVNLAGGFQYLVAADGQSMTVHSLEEGIARQAAGSWKEMFADARSRGLIRPASHTDMELFKQALRPQDLAASLPNGAGEARTDKSKVTAQVRDHIAGLRSILRPHAFGLR